MARIGVFGAGSWGTALALQLERVGHDIRLWTHCSLQAQKMRSCRSNEDYLPGIALPPAIAVFDDIHQAALGADYFLIVTPSHAFGETLGQLVPFVNDASGLAWACKGLEPGSGRFLHELAKSALPSTVPLALISGPSFAHEVAKGMPTAVTVAASEPLFGEQWAGLLHGHNFRAYYTSDLIGAELGGALKNVIAVACGIADGLGLGLNTRAALITRGLAEMMRLGHAIGADPKTLTGLAGMGDLVLTCTGDLSRNRRFGLALGTGSSVEDALAEVGQVVEGLQTTEEAMRLAQRWEVEMPITEQVYGILFKGWSPSKGVRVLMERDLKAE